MNNSTSSLKEFFSLDDVSKQKLSEIAKTKEFQALKTKLSKELHGVPVTEALIEMVIKELSQLLNIDVRAILLSAWNKSGEILRYADTKKYPAGETYMVPLAEHTITSEHKPSVQLSLNKVELGEIKLDIRLELAVKGVILKIQDARIKAFSIGSCQGKGSVKYGDLSLLQRKSEPFTLPGSFELGAGIPLNDTIADVHYVVDTVAKA